MTDDISKRARDYLSKRVYTGVRRVYRDEAELLRKAVDNAFEDMEKKRNYKKEEDV